ncbi:hypothetical protein WA158_004416 [Blastocystis sp. Blastoise]
MKALFFFMFVTLYIRVFTEKPKLQLHQDQTFKITQFTDLHFGDSDNDSGTYNIMKKVLEADRPDFIAFTGDMVAGYGWDKKSGWYEKKWRHFSSIANETKIYYGYALGNHDEEADLKRKQIIELDMTNPWSMSELAPKETVGASNFVIPVYEYNSTSRIAFNMWFLDSMRSGCMGISGYGCVELETIEWYYKKSEEMEKEQGYKIPAVSFFHIPPPEFMTSWDDGKPIGRKDEHVCCFPANPGLIAAMKKRGDMHSVYVGHDHTNDYIVNYEGIDLIYGRKTGIGCYGPSSGVKRGGRMIEITLKDHKMSINNYIVNEDGEKETQSEKIGITERQLKC